jgi:hypothetical protein
MAKVEPFVSTPTPALPPSSLYLSLNELANKLLRIVSPENHRF